MDLNERMRAWSFARQKLGERATTPEQALKAVVAVYATHPTAPLALWVRSRSFSAARYRKIDADRNGLRLPAMRRTVFLVPRESAARIFSAVRATPAHALRPLKRHGLTERDYERFGKKILDLAREPHTTRELEDVGIKGQQLGTVLRCLRYEGRILTIAGSSLNMAPHRYVAASVWAPEGLEAPEEDAASWLAREYLRAYGPARVEDFAWWTGLAKGVARTAMDRLDTIDVGDGSMLLRSDEGAFGSVKKVRDSVVLLPRWDAYTMGHAPDGRQRFVHPDVQQIVYTPIGVGLSGDGNPVVLVDGETVATWTYSIKEGSNVQPFDALGPKTKRRVDDVLEEISSLLSS